MDPKPVEQPKVAEKSFFGNSSPQKGTSNAFFAGNGTSGLFKNTEKADNKEPTVAPVEPKKAGLFDNLNSKEENKPSSSFFGSGITITKSGLFDGLLNNSVSNNTGCGTNLFSHTSTPLTGMFANASGGHAGGEDDEDEADGDEDEVPGQEDATDPTKSTGNYKYEETTTVISSVVFSHQASCCKL